jgi:AsmA-like C-terminal region
MLLGLAGLAVIVAVLAQRTGPYLQAEIVKALENRFHARVELDSFHISFGNGLQGRWGVWAEGHGLRIWPPTKQPGEESTAADQGTSQSDNSGNDLEPGGQGAAESPLIRVEQFRFHAPLRFARGKPIVISVVQIEGLDIDVPPRAGKPRAGRPGGAAPNAMSGNEAPRASDSNDAGGHSGVLSAVIVERIECNDANLLLETNKPGKLPLGFAIAHLTLSNVTAAGPFEFEADLTNPRPKGTIHSKGSFGPWVTSDPGESQVSGDYTFENADLGDFKDIAGILNSTGHYTGTLRDIVVDGVTDTPDFRLTHYGTSMPLHTRFHAQVDGTDGDTWLQPVEATLGQSHFTAQGQVVRLRVAEDAETPNPQSGSSIENVSPFRGGHDISLNVNVDRGRIEDFMRLVSHGGAPLLTGAVTVKTTLHIPPGKTPMQERLALKGRFTLDQAQFSSAKIQGDIEQLSLRGQGLTKQIRTADPNDARSRMEGNFQMANGVITLPALAYTVPGAEIDVNGTYGVEGGALDFTGFAKMEATVSKMVGGWKGLLLTPLDRYFQKDGAGTEVPIRVKGTQEHPQFGIDFDRMKKGTSAQQPGQTQPQQPPGQTQPQQQPRQNQPQ